MKIHHFIITKFNLQLTGWDSDRTGRDILNHEWMDQRMNLFENFCLPSVRQQTNQQFTWILLLDATTSPKYRSKMDDIAADYDRLHLHYIRQGDFPKILTQEVVNLPVETTHLLTTNLDNDDALHCDFIQTLQQLCPVTESAVLDLRNGYQSILRDQTLSICELNDPFNAFVSLLAPLSSMETVYDRHHPEWESYHTIVVYTDRRLWMQLIHPRNKLNKEIRYLQRIPSVDTTAFGLSDSITILDQRIKIFLHNVQRPLHLLIEKTKRWLYQLLMQ